MSPGAFYMIIGALVTVFAGVVLWCVGAVAYETGRASVEPEAHPVDEWVCVEEGEWLHDQMDLTEDDMALEEQEKFIEALKEQISILEDCCGATE